MIRAVIADDSFFTRQVLKDVLEETQRVQVVAQAQNGKEAIDCVKAHQPDILILDCRMPVMNGLDALKQIMAECPLPVFMFSAFTSEGAQETIQALEYGAIDFLLKPTSQSAGLREIADQLVQKVEHVVLRGKFRKIRKAKLGLSPQPEKPRAETTPVSRKRIDLIAMGSSTGGVQAVMNIIPKLPKTCPPIVWVQHMPPYFTKSFAVRLNEMSQISVKEAKDGDRVAQGICFLAPGDAQMRIVETVGGSVLKVGGQEKRSGHCPSCDVLFESVADYYTDNALGVILTGMGNDGTEGLVRMHNRGAYVIGQDEESCAVYGMSRAAFEAGAVDMQCDIQEIASVIIKRVGSTGP